MKVYGAPEHLKYRPDYRNYNPKLEREKEDTANFKLKEWLIGEGYTGPLTGEIVYYGVADGNAQYMIADAGRRSCLIHIGDSGYHYQGIEHFPKSAIVKRLEQHKVMAKLFGK